MFFFCGKGLIENFKTLMPELWEQIESVLPDNSNTKEVYSRITPQSFDHGIMEPLQSRLCLRADIGWSDLGSWKDIFNTKTPVQTKSQDIEVDGENNLS